MSRALDMLAEGWTLRLIEWGETLKLGAAEFKGILLPLATVDPDLALVKDIRETCQLQVAQADCPEIKQGNIVTQGTDQWKVVERVNNPADFIVTFTVVKVVDGKDTTG